ncbi:MAG: hypothetical protein U9N35_07435 [Euryarchaeota archaeon]|nr:hypothetical protein [Euryarchaeota archaeon]
MLSKDLMEIYKETAPHIANLKRIKEILSELEGEPREEVVKKLKKHQKEADPTLRTDITIVLRSIAEQ